MPEYIVTSTVPVDLPELVRCKDCEKWDRNDGMLKDIDDEEWHHCKPLCFLTIAYFYCADAKREVATGDRSENCIYL